MTWSPSHELAVATERDFERKVLPHLRLHWPELVQALPRRSWDQKGIDLLTDPSSAPIDCIVQCKGFEVEQIGDDQVRQIRDSISVFRDSDKTCRTYLVVHNRDHRDPALLPKIRPHLDELCELGKAEEAEIWSRQEVVKKSREAIRQRIDEELRERSTLLLERESQLFDGLGHWVMSVPCAEQKLKFKRFEPCKISHLSNYKTRDVRDILLTTSNTRWTMLTGHFGMGKTTAALLTAKFADRSVIFIECGNLPIAGLGSGTNALLAESLKTLGLFADNNEDERRLYEFLAGRTLAQLLKAQSDDYLLVFDALDENRFYARLRGLHLLSNQLAELSCPIVLITRREHFEETFGDIGSALFEWSTKNAPKREARVVDLGLWEIEDVCEFLRGSLEGLDTGEINRVNELIQLIEDRNYADLYGELPRQPLFLQFILSDVIEEGLQESNRCTLLSRWVARKIRRDRVAARESLGGDHDTADFVRRMLLIMEEVASRMVIVEEDRIELLETIGEDVVKSIAGGFFEGPIESVLGIVLNSVIVPSGVRSDDQDFQLRFLHRVFQEVFLSRFLKRKDADPTPYPMSVRAFFEELAEVL